MKCITANDMAGNNRNDQKSFRNALRFANLRWHAKHAPWKACSDGQKQDMKRVHEA
jgi:hypothetical protein